MIHNRITVSTNRYMNLFWEYRYATLIWWITIRYLLIGLEFIFLGADSSNYWPFGNVSPVILGYWMFIVGVVGMSSRFLCWKTWCNRASWSTMVFALGVAAHSMFRMAMLVQEHRIGDPLFVLFFCDTAAMFLMMIQLLRARIHTCIL